MRGRPPKPTALKLIEGNRGRRKIAGGEPRPARGRVTCPAALDAEARREWARIVKILEPLELFTPADRAGLAVYCQTFSDYLRYCRRVRAEGDTIETTNGNVIQAPWVGMRNKSAALLAVYLGRFGLTPADRVRLAVEADGDLDDFAQYQLERKRNA